MRNFFYVFCILLLCLFSCQEGNTPGDTPGDTPVASLSIVSVTPDSGLTNGIVQAFTVTVNYELSGTSQGELSLGFNNGTNITSFSMISSAKKIVAGGSGQHTFNVNALTKDWGAEGDFKVLATISDYPHPDSWHPLAGVTHKLTF